MIRLEPERLRPGLGGYSPEARSPEEAALILNLELDHDQVWRPRPGRVKRATYGGTVKHVSIHPNGTNMLIIEGGSLRWVTISSYADSAIDTGWPSSGFIKHAIGNTGSASVWCACKAATTDTAAALKIVNGSGTVSTPSNVTGNWVEAHGALMLATKPNEFQWSSLNDCTTWSALDAEPVNQRLGTLVAACSLGESQTLLLGDRSCSILRGAVEDLFSQEAFTGLPVLPYGVMAVTCGKSVVVSAPGPRLYLLNASGQVMRIDEPIHRDLITITNWDNVYTYWDPVRDEYCLSSPDQAQTWRYSIARNIWVGTEPQPVIGMAVLPVQTNYGQRRFVGVFDRLIELDYATYTDDVSGASPVEYTCALETYITDRGMPDRRKQLNKVFIGCNGSWDATLYYRNDPEDSWSSLVGVNETDGNGFVYFAANVYKERKIRVSAPAASGVFVRDVHVYEDVIGGDV